MIWFSVRLERKTLIVTEEDKPDHLILHVGTNDMASENKAEGIAKSIVDLAKSLVADDRTISISNILSRNDNLNGKAAEVNSYLEKMCSKVNTHFIDNARVFNPKRHLNNGTVQKMKFPIKDFFSKYDQIRSFLRIWSHLLKKSLMENFHFCAV